MHDTRASIRKFLGPAATENGPFGLLGIDRPDVNAAAVSSTLQQQLDRVSSHPEGDTPEADEVRLALHAAAAQLMDPRVRDHLAERWQIGKLRPTAPAVEPHARAGVSRGTDDDHRDTRTRAWEESAQPRKRRDGLATLIVGGGVIAFALIGLTIAGILVFARTPAAPAPLAAGAPATGGAASSTAAAPLTEEEIAAAEEAQRVQAAATAAPIAVPAERAASTPQAVSRTTAVDARRALKDLRDAIEVARNDPPAALPAIQAAIRQLSDWWANYDPGMRRACDDAVIEALYALGNSAESQDAVLGLITSMAERAEPAPDDTPRERLHPNSVWPAAWATGILTRLSRERDLPMRIAATTAESLDHVLGMNRPTQDGTFETGAMSILRRMTLRITGNRAGRPAPRDAAAGPSGSTLAIRRWIDACEAVTNDETTRERLFCDGLETLLVSAHEPEEDLGVFEAIGAIVERIKWRAGGPARPRLLDWFRDRRISDGDIRVVTVAIAGKSGAEGVDSSMSLSVNPGADDRSRLRGAYAAAWKIERASREVSSQEWRSSAEAMTSRPAPTGEIEILRAAAECARLNEAARLLWRGETETANALLRQNVVIVSGPTPQAGSPPNAVFRFSVNRGGGGVDGLWAERYLAAERSIPARLQLLDELERSGSPVGAVDAAILMQEAVIGSPIQVRYAAAKLAGQWADEPTVVAAALDELPLAPRTRTLGELMERMTRRSLPAVTDADWELVTRRALVERLLGMLAAGTAEASTEEQVMLIADSYLRASGEEPARGPGAAAEGAERGSSLLWTATRAEAEAVAPVISAPLSLDEIDRRRMGRLSLARGPVQVFAAEQASIAEAMSYVVAGERPTATAEVAKALARLQTGRRAAKHVFEQLLATERAILELWRLRFGEPQGGAS